MLISINRLVSNPMFICTAYSCLDHQLFEAPSRTLEQSKLFPHLEQRTINKYSLNVFCLNCNKMLSKPLLLTTQQRKPNESPHSSADVHNGRSCNSKSIQLKFLQSKYLTYRHPDVKLKLVKGGRTEVNLDELHTGFFRSL